MLGVERIKRQRTTDQPKSPSFKPRIKFICFDKKRLEELLEGYRLFNGGYRQILGAFYNAARRGRRATVEWPYGSYPPSCHRPIGFSAAA